MNSGAHSINQLKSINPLRSDAKLNKINQFQKIGRRQRATYSYVYETKDTIKTMIIWSDGAPSSHEIWNKKQMAPNGQERKKTIIRIKKKKHSYLIIHQTHISNTLPHFWNFMNFKNPTSSFKSGETLLIKNHDYHPEKNLHRYSPRPTPPVHRLLHPHPRF